MKRINLLPKNKQIEISHEKTFYSVSVAVVISTLIIFIGIAVQFGVLAYLNNEISSVNAEIEQLKKAGYKVFAVEQVKDSLSLEKINFNYSDKIAVVFGNEVTGVEQETILHCDGCIEIPQLGMKHSLNIATAAGVVLWEIVRSRMIAQ